MPSRLLGWLAVFALLLGGGAAGAQNLLDNGDFERPDIRGGAAGWANYTYPGSDSATAKLVTPGYRTKQAILITETKNPSMFGIVSQPVDATALPSEEVLFTCYYKTEGDPRAQLSLVGFAEPFLPKEWATPYLQSETEPLAASKEWALASWRFRMIPGAKDLVAIIRVGAIGKLWVDQASLQAYPTSVRVEVKQAGTVEFPPSRRRVELALTNRTEQARRLQLLVFALAPERKPVTTSSFVELPAGRTASVDLSYPYDYRVPHTVRVLVQDGDTGAVYEQRDVAAPGLVSARLAAPAFRNAILNGLPTPKLVVVGRANVPRAFRERLQISAELIAGGAGRSFRAAEAPEGDYRLELDLPELVSGVHAVRVTARYGDALQTVDLTFQRLPLGTAQTGYDDQMRLWSNGKVLLPRGLYGINTVEDVQRAAAAGFNFVVVPSTRASYEVQDAIAKAGLQAVISAGGADEDFWSRQQVKWGGLPLTLGWIPYSRPDLRTEPPQFVTMLYEDLKRISPTVPVIAPLASPSRARYYAGAADILLAWSMPVPRSPLRALGEMMDVLQECSGGAKPIWALVQAAGGSRYEDQHLGLERAEREPTAAEMRALAYLGLLHGARGLVWYSLELPAYAGTKAYRMWEDAPELWAALAPLNLQLRWLTPVLLEGQRELLPAVGQLQMARWRYQGGEYVIAVNCSERGVVTPLTAFTPGKDVQALFEDRTLEADADGAIEDSFAPYGVHIYAAD